MAATSRFQVSEREHLDHKSFEYRVEYRVHGVSPTAGTFFTYCRQDDNYTAVHGQANNKCFRKVKVCFVAAFGVCSIPLSYVNIVKWNVGSGACAVFLVVLFLTKM